MGLDDEAGPVEWDATMQPFLSLWAQAGSRVAAVHMEHVEEESGGKATLQTTDAWVDTSTRGARLITKSSLPLQLVATAPGDIHVYAARDHDRVEIILLEPNRTLRSWQGIVQFGSQSTSQSSCRHARATLKADKGSAEITTFVTVAELTSTTASEAKAPLGGKSESASKAPGLPPTLDVEDETRTRPLHVHASVSWASRDRDPVVSVTMGWEGREQTSAGFGRRPKAR